MTQSPPPPTDSPAPREDSPPAPRASNSVFGILGTLEHRPRLLVGAILMVATFVVLRLGVEMRDATRLLIAWNVGAWVFLVMIAFMAADRGAARWEAKHEDENQWVLAVLGVAASLAAFAAIVWELGPVKNMAGWEKAAHLTLVAMTVLSAWTFLQVMFGLHYAGVYYKRHRGVVHGGLAFPECAQPGWMEFFYHAFTVGCTFAASDVNVTSMRMRRLTIVQGVVGFFFNAIILALAINIAANLF
jgi:uncharacterized membrane protein